MPQIYTRHDMDLAGHDFAARGVASPDLLLAFLTSSGTIAQQIEFQFPPRVTNDSRKAHWQEGEMRGTEPQAAFKTSGPREIALQWVYIVDALNDADGADSRWTPFRIRKNVLMLRSYFARLADKDTRNDQVLKLKLWTIGGAEPITARLLNVGIRPGDTMVGPSASAYPLRTDVSIDIRLWYKGKGRKATQDIDALLLHDPEDPNSVVATWY